MKKSLCSKYAFSLIELSIAMGVMAVLASSIVPIAIRSVQIRAGEKTALEMNMIQEASRNYYIDNHLWPADILTLQSQGYLNSQWSRFNPWHNLYQISSSTLQMSVSTDVPIQWTNLIASHLTAAVVNQTNVSSTISSPGVTGFVSGVIVAWSGAIANIPTGWALCDGANGTPDLRDKFIVGARQDVAGVAQSNIMGSSMSTGGSVSHNHTGVTGVHILTVNEIPSLQVTIPTFSPNQGGNGSTVQRGQDPTDGSLMLNTTGGGAGHSHTILSDYHVPPFYALAFIMKL